jgi:hypothetical protein
MARLGRLEERLRPREPCDRGPACDEEFIESFEHTSNAWLFDGEPDFPDALAYYKQAILDAARDDPDFYPPDDFLPGQDEGLRRREWRRGRRRHPGLDAAFFWMDEICERVNIRNGLSKDPGVLELIQELRKSAWLRASGSDGDIPIQ